ncbi:hypothetical protein E6W39_15460 [Kitasatospora acidiphila]|uniref:Uncharacterized protein n=1 Tax=Kitasatospora acidiphila TaxID=2567942 RepID=A0A540W318_9ACTN|nr:hypothetical protein [Kitasatospora acidiphila]TQF03372.1 hypothetical protein E6W39_15460 [Kitasatospora acidiphila]
MHAASPTSPLPFDQAAALSELRTLGRTLDLQVTERTGTTAPELDATLYLMRQLHTQVELSLSASLCSVVHRSLQARAA